MSKPALAWLFLLLAGSAFAQDQEARIEALEKDNQELRASLDDIQRAQTAIDPIKLAEALQWGSGWGMDAAFGSAGTPAQLRFGIISPKLANLLTTEFRLHGLEMTRYKYISDLALATDMVQDYGLQASTRLSVWTPMFFNFTRAYVGGEGMLTAASDSFDLIAARYSLRAWVMFGFEIYLAKWVALFGEAGGPLGSRVTIAHDVPNHVYVDDMTGGNFVAGLRFYLGK
ncbi:MAG: hypothetical protein ACOYM2_01645 [Rectinemataceae bacterium]